MKDAAKASIELISKWLQFQVYKRELPGLSVGVFVEDETLLVKSFGYKNVETHQKATPGTLYRIASHSKLFTASAIMKLFAEGKLRLDDRISDHLEWFHSSRDPNMAHVTIRHLLSHSSGLNRDGVTAHWDNDDFPDADRIREQVKGGLSSFEVGEHWKYSNMGFTILGMVIEAVTGSTYEAAIRDKVLGPMGLRNTRPDFDSNTLPLHATGYGRKFPGRSAYAFEHVHANAMNSATGFSSNVADLIQFYRFHLPGNEAFLPDRDKREMQRIQFQENEYTWGLGWSIEEIDGKKIIGHSGGYPGFLTRSFMEPESKIIVVVLTNSLEALPAEFARGIYQIIQYAFRNKTELSAGDKDDPALCDEIAGFYGNRWGVVLFDRLDGKLVAISPEDLDPAMLAARYTYLGKNRFIQSAGSHNGGFGEVIEAVKDTDLGVINLKKGESVLEPFAVPR
jgi:CubicO group peptidase (beta-lactamase class C family)